MDPDTEKLSGSATLVAQSAEFYQVCFFLTFGDKSLELIIMKLFVLNSIRNDHEHLAGFGIFFNCSVQEILFRIQVKDEEFCLFNYHENIKKISTKKI